MMLTGAAPFSAIAPPQDTTYGMREFNVVDPDRNQLTFGMATSNEKCLF
jgi:hypothetical protein